MLSAKKSAVCVAAAGLLCFAAAAVGPVDATIATIAAATTTIDTTSKSLTQKKTEVISTTPTNSEMFENKESKHDNEFKFKNELEILLEHEKSRNSWWSVKRISIIAFTLIAVAFMMLFIINIIMKRFCSSDPIKHNVVTVKIEEEAIIPKVEPLTKTYHFNPNSDNPELMTPCNFHEVDSEMHANYVPMNQNGYSSMSLRLPNVQIDAPMNDKYVDSTGNTTYIRFKPTSLFHLPVDHNS